MNRVCTLCRESFRSLNQLMDHVGSKHKGVASSHPRCFQMASEQVKSDLQILKNFILGFTARDVDKEWKAYQRLRNALLGEYL